MLNPKMKTKQGKIQEHLTSVGPPRPKPDFSGPEDVEENAKILREGGRRVIVNRETVKRPAEPQPVSPGSVISQVVEDFLREHQARKNIAPATFQYYQKNLDKLLIFCAEVGIASPMRLTPQRAEQYTGWLLKQKRPHGGTLSAHTVHKCQRVFRMFSKWATKRGYMPEDSAAEVDMVKFRADARIRYLTEEQLNKVLKVPKINTTSGLRTYVAVYLLAATGIRQGELLALHRSDLSDKEHLLRIRAETSKSKRERYVPLPEEQRGERITLAPEIAGPLMKYVVWRDKLGLGPEDALFVNNQGQSWSRFSLSSVLKRIGQKLGFTLSAHVFRHTCAVMLLKKSGDLKLVYDILGHSTFEVTKQYLRFTPADIQARYRAAGHMGSVIVPTRKLPSAADVDKAIKKFGKTERELSDMLFEVSLREG